VSLANRVPETWELSGDDAWETLKRTGRWRLAKDAFTRFRASDGTSHARSLAFLLALLLVQGIILLVAIASMMSQGGGWADLFSNTLRAVAPGPSGKVLTDAVEQAQHAGHAHALTVVVAVLIASVITAASLMGQVERGMNRLYGIERDRPTLRMYGRALVLALTAGTLTVGAFLAIALGHVAATSFGGGTALDVWLLLRWPVGLVLATAGTALVFRWSPFRRQPAWSWLTFGATVAVGLWMLATLGLNVFFEQSSSFGRAYGPLAGMVALLLWSYATAIATLYGAAIAAQLEAVRAGDPEPLDPVRPAVSDEPPTAEPALAGVGTRVVPPDERPPA
jgi:YihY family inner membrane protein